MYNVLVVSDSHGLTDELEQVSKRHKVDLAIHCGDSELPSDAPQLASYKTVAGNCDWNGTFPNEKLIEIGGLRFFISHGHQTNVKTSLMNLQYRALEHNADVACFGHTHIAYAEKVDNCLLLNPGSIRLPKYFSEPSYVLLEWENPAKVDVTFYHVSGEVITSFPYEKHFSFK